MWNSLRFHISSDLDEWADKSFIHTILNGSAVKDIILKGSAVFVFVITVLKGIRISRLVGIESES